MPNNRKLTRYAAWTVITLLLLLALLRLVLAPLTAMGLNSWFEQQGIESSVEDISFDINDGQLTLSKLDARKAGLQVLALDRLDLGWSWSGLFDRQIILGSIAVSGLSFDVEHRPDAGMVIAGIELDKLASQNQSEPAATDSEPLQWTVAVKRLILKNFELCYRALPQHDLCNKFERLSWNGDIGLDLARLSDPVLPLQASGNFKLAKLKIRDNRLGRGMLGFDEFEMQEVRVDGLDNIAIKLIAFDTLTLFERPTDPEHASITRLKAIQVYQLALTDRSHLDIGELKLQGHEALVVSLASNKLELNEWLARFDAEETKAETVSTGESTKPFTFAIASFNYQTEKSLAWRDESFAKPFILDLHAIELNIEKLDSRQPEQSSKMHYSARLGKHATITIDGNITPLDPKPSFDLAGRVEGMDLRYLSPITTRSLGHKIRSGQMDADLELKAEHNVLTSRLKLTLHHFDLDAVSEADKEKIDSSFGFPLDSSLSLLKDRDDNIELEIPVTGDLQNPDFDPTDAITKATSSAITTAVLNYYTPFGLVTLADGLFSLATALNFDPVIFEPNVSEVSGSGQEALKKIAGLMQERPGIYITLCAYTSSADRKLMLPETVDIAADELKLDADQLEKLAKLGEIRAAAVKDFLVAYELDPARLVLCDSEHIEAESLARVEITI